MAEAAEDDTSVSYSAYEDEEESATEADEEASTSRSDSVDSKDL
jgi:hypothetical protein